MRASTWLGFICTLSVFTGCGFSAGPGDAGCTGAAKSPPNLMLNGGFECAPAEWMGVMGQLSIVTTGASEGSRAAQVTIDATGTGGIGSVSAVVPKTSGKTYCINAKVKGTASDVRLEVFGSQLTSFGSPLNSPNTWVRLPPSTNLEIREPIDQALFVKVRANNGKAGDTVIVDDIDLWESSDGKCKER